VTRRPERVRVGTAGKPHGLAGLVVIEDACGWYAFTAGSELLVDGQPRRVDRRAGTDSRPLVGFDGVQDRAGAEALRNAALEIALSDAPPPAPDTWFRFDLIGLGVWHRGRLIGRVVDIEEGVAHDLLVLDPAVRVPFVAALVPVVDPAAGRIELSDELQLD
jgi:16S rRNA processing protein RimM